MELKWTKPDEHHIATACGTYAVSRINRGAQVMYTAWVRPYTALGDRLLAAIATDAEKLEAIKAMKELCVAHSKQE